MSFRIVVDSCGDLTPTMKQDPIFSSVPLTIELNGKFYVDDSTFQQADLLWAMKQCEDAPTTSCPSPAQYMDAFGDGTDDIYVVTLSALLSGSHNAAVRASDIWLEEYPDARIHIFNSCSATAGQLRIALEIQRLASQGLPFQQVVREVNQFIADMQTLFVLESLDNLRKNGRLTKMQAIITSTLKLRLLCAATPEGEICKRGQALSTKQALAKMVEFIEKDPNRKDRTVTIAHCNCLERAFGLKQIFLEKGLFDEVVITETGGIATVYANDGGVVVAY